MKLSNAITRINKQLGTEMTQNGQAYYAVKNSKEIKIVRNGLGDDVALIKVRRLNDLDDSMADYTAGFFCDSIKQAIEYVNSK